MDDLISRQELSNLLVVAQDEDFITLEEYEKFWDLVDRLPSEIIRCKDCKHYQPFDDGVMYDCIYGMSSVTRNDYCSRAEQREEKYTCSKCRWRFKVQCPKGSNSKDDDFCDFFVQKEGAKDD